MLPLPLKFDAQGLVPTIVQDHVTGEIRMFAFATDAAVRRTLETGSATFWSRSRGELWQKGRSSGELTPVASVLADCDADCLIYACDPHGPSCHSGAPSCFFHALDGTRLEQASQRPQTALAALEASLDSGRKPGPGAVDAQGGAEPGGGDVASKIREQAGALAQALEEEGDERVVSEAADALCLLVAGLHSRSIALRRVLAEVSRRVTDGEGAPPAIGR
jgi:phosphoribosyl-ATP pyrophosphohydrolase/phosphoribosyl-AMP cyclohydrolase